MKMRFLAAAFVSVCALSACTPGMNAAVETVQQAVQGDRGAASARLDPNFRYLRVTIGGRVAFLALGYVDSHPDGPIEVWYSALREVVRLQNGRVVGVTGLNTEWRNVSISDAPPWSAADGAQQPVRWMRVRDVMPGYRFGVRDDLALRVIPASGRSELQGVDPKSLTWFEERLRSDALPPAHYVVDLHGGKNTVVYGEQCIAPDICFTWQRWSAEQQNRKSVSVDR